MLGARVIAAAYKLAGRARVLPAEVVHLGMAPNAPASSLRYGVGTIVVIDGTPLDSSKWNIGSYLSTVTLWERFWVLGVNVVAADA